MARNIIAASLLMAALGGCAPSGDVPAEHGASASSSPSANVEASPAVLPSHSASTANAAGRASAPIVLCVGTSLTAGYGLDPDDAWPAVLEQKIRAAGLPHRVVNAGVSGETSAGARRRVDWLLRQPVEVFVLETGANDALRGQDVAATRDNVEAILRRAKEQQPAPRLVLVGMQAPPNLGSDYTRTFAALFPDLARAHGATLVPFLLEGVAGVPRLNLPDGVHPTAEGHRVLADTVWKTLEPVLRARATG